MEQPGLPPEVADIRQALVSALAGPGTIDSFIVTALHARFHYRPFGANDQEVLPDPPTIKEGIFVEWIPSVPELSFDPTLISSEAVDEYYQRLVEDVAYLNWDPNRGNQKLTISTGGRLGVRYGWKQFDLDKTFPAGFISLSTDPFWQTSPLAREPLSPFFRNWVMTRDVEREIQDAERFWNHQIEQKIKRLYRREKVREAGEASDDMKKEIEALEACRWTLAHANTLRAADTLLKVAVEADATPCEIFQLYCNTNNYQFTMQREAFIDHIRETYPEFPEQNIDELQGELHVHSGRGDPLRMVDLHSALSRHFVLAKAWAIGQVNPLTIDPQEREQRVIRLTKVKLRANLLNAFRANRFPAPSSSN